MDKKWVRITLKVLKYTAISLVSLLVLLVLFVWIFEDRIKQYAVDQLNQYLNTEVKVGDIELTVFGSFPQASLEFTDVLIMDPPGINKQKDTMLFAQKLSLDFSIWDILSDNYTVNDMEIKKGIFRLYVDDAGKENYIFWKEQQQKDTSSNKFRFLLEHIRISESELEYVNRVNKQQHSVQIKNLALTGKFTEKKFMLRGRLNAFLKNIKNKNVSVISGKKSTAVFELDIDREKDKYTFGKTWITLGKMPFTLSGSISEGENGTQCNMLVEGNDIDITDILSTWPGLVGDEAQNYGGEGKLKCSAKINGMMSKTEMPAINAEFSVKEGKLTEKKNNITLTGLSFNGTYTNDNTYGAEELTLNGLSAQFKDGKFSGNLLLTDFENPKIKSDFSGDVNLGTLHRFFHFDNVKNIEGRVGIKGNINGTWLYSSKNDSTEFVINKAEGNINLQNVSLRLEDQPAGFNHINGEVIIKNNNATVDGLTASVNATAFTLNGILKNFVPWLLFPHRKMNIVAELYSDYISIEDLLGNPSEENKNTSAPFVLKFPDDINFNLDAGIKKLSFETFTAENVSGNFKLIDKIFTAGSVNLHTAGGKLSGNVEVDGRTTGNFFITSQTEIQQVNISQLFSQFKNFGQSVVSDQHVKGKLDASVTFGAVADSTLTIQTDKVISVATVKISNGELVGLQSMTDIATYMRQNKKLKLVLGADIDDLEKRLKHITFSELNNTIHIKNGKVNIPAMEISSSAMKINLSGEHSFSNDIDYHINFRFMELRARNSETEYGFITDDGTGLVIFLRMFGTVDNPQFEEDEKERKEFRKEYNANEIKNLKSIFKEEFGLFKKDSTLKVTTTPKEDVKFLLEWDNEKKQQPADTLKAGNKKNNKRFDKFKNKYGEQKQDTKFKMEAE